MVVLRYPDILVWDHFQQYFCILSIFWCLCEFLWIISFSDHLASLRPTCCCGNWWRGYIFQQFVLIDDNQKMALSTQYYMTVGSDGWWERWEQVQWWWRVVLAVCGLSARWRSQGENSRAVASTHNRRVTCHQSHISDNFTLTFIVIKLQRHVMFNSLLSMIF